MKNTKILTLGIPLLCCALVSCTENNTTSSSSSGEISSVSFEFWHTFGQKNGEALKKSAENFKTLVKENEGVDVNITLSYQGSYDDIEDKILKSFTTGTPTMAIAYPDHVAGYIDAEKGQDGRFVYNIDDYMNDSEIGFGKQAYLGDKEGKDDFVEAFIDEGTHFARKGTFTLPFMKSSEVMFYNVEATLNVMKFYKPEITTAEQLHEYMNSISWDELFKICDSARENKDDVLSTMEVPTFYDSDANLFISKLFQNNIGYSSIDSDGKGVIDFETGENRTKAEAFVTSLKEQKDKGNITTKGLEGTYGSDHFKTGKCIFTMGSSGGTGYQSPTGGTFTVGVCKVPASNNNPLYVTQGPCITFLKSSTRSEEENNLQMRYAWRFAKYLTNADTNVYQCVYGSEGYIPVRYSAYDTAEFNEFFESRNDEGGNIYAEAADVLINKINGTYLNTAIFPGSSKLRENVESIVVKSLLEQTTVTQAFDEAISASKLSMS